MAGVYKTGRRPRYGRKQYKKRFTRLQKKYNSSMFRSMSMVRYNKFFPTLPTNNYLCVPCFGDTRYTFDTYSSTQPSQCRYIFWDCLDMSQNLNTATTGLSALWWYVQLINQMQLYQEGRYKMAKLSIDTSLDAVTTNYISGNSQNPPDRLDVAFGAVPLSYLKTSAGTQHTYNQAGNWQTDVDYYSALTHMKAASFYSLTTDGQKSNYKASAYIDGYSHTGTTQSINSTMTWGIGSVIPTTNITWPNPSTRQVFLLALRHRCHSDVNITNNFSLRISLKMDQHIHFTDSVPNMPYATTTQIV